MDAANDQQRPDDDPDAPKRPRRALTCPFCHSAEVEPLSRFGSQLMTEQYYCRACRTPFERVRDDEG